MPLHPEIAAITTRLKPSPPLASIEVSALRARANEGSARAPRGDMPSGGIVDRRLAFLGREIGARLYLPDMTGPRPALVYYHGGGYVLGNLDIADGICRSLCRGANCVVISIDYRLAPEHPFPAPFDDAWDAFVWTSEHCGELGIDKDRIGVAGDSAGGNLAAAVAIKARDTGRPISVQLLLYASPDFPDPTTASAREFADGPLLRAADSLVYWGHYLKDPADRLNPMAAPARAQSHAGLPPAFLAHGECDPSRDLGERYAKLLEDAGSPVHSRRYAGMPHGFFSFLSYSTAVRDAMGEICGWLIQQWSKNDG